MSDTGQYVNIELSIYGSVFMATAGSVIATLLTIPFHTFRFATHNPVNMIRNE